MSKSNTISRRDLLKAGGVVAATVATVSLLSNKAEAAKETVPRWAMVIDLRKCVGCFSCQVSCKMENSVPMEGYNARVNAVDRGEYPKPERIFLPTLCNHCAGEKDVPPCVEKCPQAKAGERAKLGGVSYRTGATYKRPDGAILLDMSLCIGCYKCIEACPYGARYINPHIKLTRADREKDLGIGKCTFCQHRVDEGLEPACVRNCVGKARFFGDLNDPNSEVAKLIKNNPANVLKPEEKTNPNVYYIKLDAAVAKMEDLLNPKAKK
ncbi:MAG: 4Fe-4S dicluster domain-containing protein [Nitrospirae bacterium]|nr:4Fe-4S dicluster domain-containing protein [Nitrospirota bacterium]